MRKFTPSDGGAIDTFGGAVSLSGSIALVGSPQDDDNGTDSGSAYLYNANTGSQIAKLKPSDGAANDYFGRSVAISANTALVGSWQDDDNGSASGSAYLFNATTGSQTHKLKPSDGAASDLFGHSVAISGNTALIGSFGDDSFSGSAYLFNATTGQQISKLTANDRSVFTEFGKSVAISGTTAIIGSPSDNQIETASGAAYLFNVNTGQQIAKLKPSDPIEFGGFGYSVAISGNTGIVGTASELFFGEVKGSAYLFNVTTGQQIAKLTLANSTTADAFGFSVALSGSTALVGTYFSGNNTVGSAQIYDATTGTLLNTITASDGAGGDQFGSSVSISGNTLLVGSDRDSVNGIRSGSAFFFAQDELLPSPLSGGTITFDPVERNNSITLDDIPSITNSGGPGSIINVTGFAFSGPDAALFDLPGYANVTLTAGAFDNIAYDLTFLGASLVGDYSATLTLFTDSGNVTYDIATLVFMPGDANFDNQVDSFDYSVIDDNFGLSDVGLSGGDLNQDGFVDSFDYSVVDDNFGTGIGGILRPASSTEIFIPEPTSLTLLALPGLLLARRR